MKKKLLTILLILSLILLTGCEEKNTESESKRSSDNQIQNNNEPKTDHKIYKYMKMSASNTSSLINVAYIFDDPSVVGSGDSYYKPCLIAEFDTNTGKATLVKYYAFFLDYVGSSTWVDNAIDKFNESGDSYKKDITNVSKGRVDNNVTYLVATINPESYIFNQYLQDLLREQNIEKYKKTIFYDRLYNYEQEPAHEEGENYFEESLEGIRIEWGDSDISEY